MSQNNLLYQKEGGGEVGNQQPKTGLGKIKI